jgi:AcrR family transcriptional regulator
MHEHRDLRVKRTHALLRRTLIDLIAEKGFDAVTVGDIAERAMVNRSTFYRHYPDKYALVTRIIEDAVNQAVQVRSYAVTALRQRLQTSPWQRVRQSNGSDFMPEEVAIMSLANWLVGMFTWWLEDGMAYTPSQIATWSLRCIAQGYVSALGIDTSMVHESRPS